MHNKNRQKKLKQLVETIAKTQQYDKSIELQSQLS